MSCTFCEKYCIIFFLFVQDTRGVFSFTILPLFLILFLLSCLLIITRNIFCMPLGILVLGACNSLLYICMSLCFRKNLLVFLSFSRFSCASGTGCFWCLEFCWILHTCVSNFLLPSVLCYNYLISSVSIIMCWNYILVLFIAVLLWFSSIWL